MPTKTKEEKEAEAQARAEAHAARKAERAEMKAVSVDENRAARLEAVGTARGRFALLRKFDKATDGTNDEREEVINISLQDPGTYPHLPGLEDDRDDDGKVTNPNAGAYAIAEAPEGVTIGMRRGGEYLAVAGFGWKDKADYEAHGSPIGAGATRLADVGVSA